MLPLVYTQITFTQVSTPDLKSSSSGLAQANAEPNSAPEEAPEKIVRMMMSDYELRKHFKALNWGVRSSTPGKEIKFHHKRALPNQKNIRLLAMLPTYTGRSSSFANIATTA